MDKIECMMIKRAVLGTLLAWLIVATAGLIILGLSGCSSVPLPSTTCHYILGAPTAEGDALCSVERGDAITFTLDGDQPIVLVVQSTMTTGYARLESATTKRNLSGEVYGLSQLVFNGCTDWGGHASWAITPSGWQLELVATCALSPTDIFNLDGEITTR